MKYFVDTEFIELNGKLDLLSIALVAEDGREFYAKNVEANFSAGSDWLRENVYSDLDLVVKTVATKQFGSGRFIAPKDYSDSWYSRLQIKDLLIDFLAEEEYGKAEFYGYYAACDFICLYQLFGTLIEFPYQQYITDIKALQDFLGLPDFPPQVENKHHALADARWIKDCYDKYIRQP